MSRRRKYTEPEPMTEETKALLAENRKAKQAEETERRVAAMAASTAATSWRSARLRRYTRRVLELHGRERLEFMDANPIGGLFA